MTRHYLPAYSRRVALPVWLMIKIIGHTVCANGR